MSVDSALRRGSDDVPDEVALEAPLLPLGNPLRLRAIPLTLVGMLLGIVAMATQVTPRLVVPVAMLSVLLVAVGILDFLGSFDEPEQARAHHCHVAELVMPAALALGGALVQLALLRAAVAGVLPVWGSAVGMPLAFLAMVVGIYLAGERMGPWRVDEEGRARPLWRRHGFWLIVVATLLYLPMLGNHGLSDPWETHYGEVSREILARNDWISLWWVQDGWFWSKPVLSFWMQAAAMALTGVPYEPGAMLATVAVGRAPQPEWPLRMTVFVLTVLGVYLLYKGVARAFGRRAALLGGIVLLTMPQFFLIAHQTMTDMPFAACMAAAVGLFLLGVQIDPDERARASELRWGRMALRLSLFHLVMGAVLLVVVPQILYLLSRNLSIATAPLTVSLHGDSFSSGSFGNCGLPGNEACQHGLAPLISLEPALQALVWLQMLALFSWMSWGERRRQRLVFLAAWLFAALASMSKGPAGLALPVATALLYVVATGRWRDLLRMEIGAGVLLFCMTALPWFVAMYARHGWAFVDKLLFEHFVKRAFGHMHDTNAKDDTSFRYYVWQLGYATFPWTGLVPIGLVRWMRGARDDARFQIAVALGGWFLVGFALFASMGTKFHHYCLPILPPAAMLTGLLLDDCLRRARDIEGAESALLGAVAVGAALCTLLVGRDFTAHGDESLGPIRLVHLFTYSYERPWPETLSFRGELWAFTLGAALLLFAMMIERLRRAMTIALVALALTFTVWGLDVYLVAVTPHWGQRELFMIYERVRKDLPGPVVAYQMNWKGENFYRGNELAAWISSGHRFQQWIDDQKKKGIRTFYVVLQHERVRTLESELGGTKAERLSDKTLNNKFILVRVQF